MKALFWACVLGLCLNLATTASAFAEMYRWTDDRGNQHFTTDLSKVPAAYRAAASDRASAGRGHVNIVPSRKRQEAPQKAASAPAARDSAPAGGPDVEKFGGYDEAWWRGKAEQYTRDIRNLEQGAKACKDIKAPAKRNTSGRRMKRQHYDRKLAAVEQCSKNQFRLDTTRKQFANFKERARKQGVPPGWLRVR